MFSLRSIARAVAFSHATRIADEEARRAAQEDSAASKDIERSASRLREEIRLSEQRDRVALEKRLAHQRRAQASPGEVASANAFVSRMAASLTEACEKEDALSEKDMAEFARLEADRRAKAEELRLAVASENHRRQAALIEASRPKPERDEQLEQERLDFMAAQLVRRTA